MSEVRFGWSQTAQRYVNLTTGRFVSQEFVTNAITNRVEAGFARLDDMLLAVIDGGADVSLFQQAFAAELRRAAAETTALAYGGWNQVPQAGWGRLGAYLREEYQFLNGFVQDIAVGKLSEAQIQARMGQYHNHLRSIYWESNRASQKDAGLTEEQRVLNPAEHCGDCVDAAGHWEPIGSLPKIGDSQCRSNCKCEFEYR